MIANNFFYVFVGLKHPREYITGAMVEYLIDQLLCGQDPRVKGYLKKYTFHMTPNLNPDGLVIIETKDRLYRKNGQPNKGFKCIGTNGTILLFFFF